MPLEKLNLHKIELNKQNEINNKENDERLPCAVDILYYPVMVIAIVMGLHAGRNSVCCCSAIGSHAFEAMGTTQSMWAYAWSLAAVNKKKI